MHKSVKIVVAALILKDNMIFAATRSDPDFRNGLYEFPGGKVEKGETDEEALRRELKEELDIKVDKLTYYDNVTYEYDDFILNMNVYKCVPLSDFTLKVHKNGTFFTKSALILLPFLPADKGLLHKIYDDETLFSFD